jgi:hypothetical protein
VLKGHGDLVANVAFTPDGRSLLSTSNDGTSRLWDLASGESRVLRPGGLIPIEGRSSAASSARLDRGTWHCPPTGSSPRDSTSGGGSSSGTTACRPTPSGFARGSSAPPITRPGSARRPSSRGPRGGPTPVGLHGAGHIRIPGTPATPPAAPAGPTWRSTE